MRRNSNGISLPLALVMLVAAALIAAAGAQSSAWNLRANTGWTDRQRALFLAESTLKFAESRLELLVDSSSANMPDAVRAQGPGFFVREDANVPVWNPWPAGGISHTADPNSDPSEYFVVYEGSVPATDGTELVGASGTTNTGKSEFYRFSIVARSGGRHAGTGVVLVVMRQF